jgi:hypothetical protein
MKSSRHSRILASNSSSQRPVQNNYQLSPLLIPSQHGPHRKRRSSIVVFVSVTAGTCMPSRCPECAVARTTENTVYLLRGLPSNSRCLYSHRLGTSLYVTLLLLLLLFSFTGNLNFTHLSMALLDQNLLQLI